MAENKVKRSGKVPHCNFYLVALLVCSSQIGEIACSITQPEVTRYVDTTEKKNAPSTLET